MHLFSQVKNDIAQQLSILAAEKSIALDPNDLNLIVVEPPKDPTHGCMATNVAMVLAKKFALAPAKLAQDLLPYLTKLPYVEKVVVAGPGFINLSMNPSFWQNELKEIVLSGVGYGNSTIGIGKKVNIEYCSANPTGPIHIGHTRGTIYGDSVALLMMKCGYEVTKEYYINDAGKQIDVLSRSAYLRYREVCGQDIGKIPDGLYPGDYLISVGQALLDKYGMELLAKEEAEWLPIVKELALSSIMEIIKNDLRDLGIFHDIFTSEQSIHDRGLIQEAIDILDKKGLIYSGILDAPKGKAPDDWEEREQLLFKSTQFGDDVDRALQKSNGSWTYLAADLGYALDKVRRGFDELIIVLGADHGGYIKRMKALVLALSEGKIDIDIKICQLVNLLKNGEAFKMSKRAGTYITSTDMVDFVGKDILRFIMLTRKNDILLDFDVDKVKEQSKDNPVFYVQYANARARSVIREAAKKRPDIINELRNGDFAHLGLLTSEAEISLVKKLAEFPRIIETACSHHEPHRVAFYLIELAASFHGFWNKGKENHELRFIIEDKPEVTMSRICLVQAVADVIASGLYVFNVEPMHSM